MKLNLTESNNNGNGSNGKGFNGQADNNEQSWTFGDYINFVRRNLIAISIFSAVGLIGATLVAFYLLDIYKSTTSIKIEKPQGSSILDMPMLSDLQGFTDDRYISTEIEILKSYTIREKTAEAMLDSFAVARKDSFYLIFDRDNKGILSIPKIVEMLDKKVDISQKRGIDIVEISVESPIAYEAALIANCYADAYYSYNLQQNRTQAVEIKDFVKEQKDIKMKDLKSIEDSLKAYQERGGVIQLDEQAKALIDQLSNFETKKNEAKIDLTIEEKTLTGLKNQLKDQEPKLAAYLESFSAQPYIEELQKGIAEYELRKQVALSNGSNDPNVQLKLDEYNTRIKNLKDQLDKKIDVFRAGLFASSSEDIRKLSFSILEEEVKVNSLKASFDAADGILSQYKVQFNNLPQKVIGLARLERIKDESEKLYVMLEEKYQEAMVNEKSTLANIKIIDTGKPDYIPVKPNRKLIVLVGLFLGIGAGFIFALGRSYFDHSIKTPEEMQDMNINLIGWIPQFEKDDAEATELIVLNHSNSASSEAFRTLRTRILFSQFRQGKIKTILVTSSMPSEGKTLISSNIAASFAQTDNKVVIIDCDLRRPRLNKVFNEKREPGFTDYLLGNAKYEEIVRQTKQKNLYIVPAGFIPPNPSEILSSGVMTDFINKLSADFDYVIIDSPPVFAVSDSEILSRHVNATILVASAQKTDKRLLQKSAELLTYDHGSFIGAVLNNFSYQAGYSTYYKRAYYYYGHSKKKKTKVDKVINRIKDMVN